MWTCVLSLWGTEPFSGKLSSLSTPMGGAVFLPWDAWHPRTGVYELLGEANGSLQVVGWGGGGSCQ